MVAWIENKDLLDEVEHDILKPNSMIFLSYISKAICNLSEFAKFKNTARRLETRKINTISLIDMAIIMSTSNAIVY